jgi:hypothetical protein
LAGRRWHLHDLGRQVVSEEEPSKEDRRAEELATWKRLLGGGIAREERSHQVDRSAGHVLALGRPIEIDAWCEAESGSNVVYSSL